MTNQEQYKIALNILARVGIDGNLQEEHARAISALNGYQSLMEMTPPMPIPQPSTVLPTNQSTGGTIPPQTTQTTTQPIMP